MAWSDIFFRPSFLTLVFFLGFSVVYSQVKRQKRMPKGLPWSNEDDRVNNAASAPEKLKKLQELYSDKGLPYVYKAKARDPVVIVPPSDLNWVITQPEAILSAQEMHRDQLQSDWVFLDENIVKSPIHQDVIRGNMVRKLDAFTEPVMDELRQCFEDYWGTSTEWHEVNIWDSMMKFFARSSNRMFVGLPLCRNEDYLAACRKFSTDIMYSVAVLSFIPEWLKPVLGYAVITPNDLSYRRGAKHLIPVIKSRLQTVQRNPEKDPADLLPNDFITWAVTHAVQASDPAERTPELICKRTMTTNFAAIHTSTTTTTNLLVDLLSSDPKLGYVESLASEVEAINRSHHGDWSKAALAAMMRVDSALRESMRVSGFVIWGVQRKVVAKDGVTLPNGTKIPCGANIAVPAWSNHHDESVYANPFEYDALRFSRQREELGGSSQRVHVGEEGLVEGEAGYEGSKDLNKVLEAKNLSTVTTGSHFMQFGHGKFSCPGRFFAVQEVKLIMAYLLLNYDIQPIDSKPEARWMGTNRLPETKTNIRIRRKATPVSA